MFGWGGGGLGFIRGRLGEVSMRCWLCLDGGDGW
jgi:hypothetical protein